jgi:PAS domain-containing protein
MSISHSSQREGIKAGAPAEALMLADAFSEFISASSRLETFYGDLQQEVNQLRLDLSERNAALTKSLDASEGMRRFLVDVIEALPCGVVVLESDGNISILNREAGRVLDLDVATGCSLEQLCRQSGVDLGAVLATIGATVDEEFDCGPAGFRFAMRCRSLQRENGQALLLILHDLTLHQPHSRREPSFSPVMLASIASALTQEMRTSLASHSGRQFVLNVVARTLRPDTHHS